MLPIWSEKPLNTGNDRMRAQISQRNSRGWKDLVRRFPIKEHLCSIPQATTIFDSLSEYYREKTISRAADDLSWHLSAQALGPSSEDLYSDERKEQECLRLSGTVDELCFEGIQLGMIRPLKMSTAGLDEDNDETPAETTARLARATGYREKFLGSITAPN